MASANTSAELLYLLFIMCKITMVVSLNFSKNY